MSTNKIDFINDLLSSKKIKIEEKSRILELTKNELKSFDSENSEIKKRIDNIEDKIKKLEKTPTSKNTSQKSNPSDKTKIKTKRHSPKTMVKFLYSFSIDEKYKWFTHSPEGLITEFDYKTYVDNANKEFEKSTGWDINGRTYYNVKNFIINTGKNNKTYIYGKGNINYSWRDLENWCNDHPNTHPYNAELNGDLFKKYINQFKQIIEFRTDDADQAFNIRVRKFIRDKLGVDFKPYFKDSFNDFGQSLKIFCDINLLFNAIEQITNWIVINKSKSNEVEINIINNNEYYQLEIIHKNSYWSISPDDEKLKGISGDFDKVRKILFSVADWEMIATLKTNDEEQNYNIVCLDQNTELTDNLLSPNIIKKNNEEIKCIKHILKLYKTQDL
jgi:hypothetical protein